MFIWTTNQWLDPTLIWRSYTIIFKVIGVLVSSVGRHIQVFLEILSIYCICFLSHKLSYQLFILIHFIITDTRTGQRLRNFLFFLLFCLHFHPITSRWNLLLFRSQLPLWLYELIFFLRGNIWFLSLGIEFFLFFLLLQLSFLLFFKLFIVPCTLYLMQSELSKLNIFPTNIALFVLDLSLGFHEFTFNQSLKLMKSKLG